MDLARAVRVATGAQCSASVHVQQAPALSSARGGGRRMGGGPLQAHKVEIKHQGEVHQLEVEEGESILDVAIEKGLELPYDCRMGVCMTCPGRLVEGEVDQTGSMLSDDVEEKGYVLLCVGQPQTDCKIETVTEDEVLDL